MKLIERERAATSDKEYYCSLTESLDKLLPSTNDLYRCYIVDSRDRYNPKNLAIRVPGCTVGHVETAVVNDKLIIINAVIAQYAIRRFQNDPNEILKQFIGQQLEFPAEDILE